jgi:hypothetical protein
MPFQKAVQDSLRAPMKVPRKGMMLRWNRNAKDEVPLRARMMEGYLHQLHQEGGMHIYTFLSVGKKRWPFAGKNRLPMKKSNVRFFHGEPVFSGAVPHRRKMHKYAFPQPSTFLVQLVQLVQPLLPHTRARKEEVIS